MSKYTLPKSIESYTLHKRELGSPKTTSVEQYVNSHGFCLTTDLLNYGFKPKDIEDAVNSEKVNAVLWPEKNSVTDLYFSNDNAKIGLLENLARRISKYCNTNTPFSEIFSFWGRNSCVVAGLAYARDKGKIQEIPNPNQENNPGYSSLIPRNKNRSVESLLLVSGIVSLASQSVDMTNREKYNPTKNNNLKAIPTNPLLLSGSGSSNNDSVNESNPTNFLNERNIKERWKKRKKK